MERSDLEQLDKPELLTIILELRAVVERLQQENEALQKRVSELEKELDQPGKTPENSSVPPALGRKPNKKAGTGGAKKGHLGRSRKRVKPDVIIECQVEHCPDCGTDLSEQDHHFLGRSQVIEIPPVEPVVVEAERYGCRCPECGRYHKADYPSGLEPQRVFGRRLETIVTYLHHLHHLSYGRLQTVLAILFGLSISIGALTNLVKRSADRLKPTAETIRDEIRQAAVVGSDETGARVNGQNQWQWVFVTDEATYHLISDSRGSAVIDQVMGDAVPLVWVRDLFSAQGKAQATFHQICHAHQLRDLQFVIDAEGSAWAYRFQSLLLRSQRLHQLRPDLPANRFKLAVAQIEADCDRLLGETLTGTEALRLQRRYLKHRSSLFVFLHQPNVPFDNNAAERALRNSVIHRKVSGGFRSQSGADAHAIVASIADTARKRQQDVFSVLQSLIGQPTPTPS